MVVIYILYILSREIGYAQSAHTLPLLLCSVADLPINTETLSSMTKHTHTYITYANVCVCVCWPSQALWPSETAAQPTTSINLVDGLPRRLPFLAHKPYEHVSEGLCI